MNRSYNTLICAGSLLFTISACKEKNTVIEETDEKKLPNIVLIVSDDQGYNDTGAYGREDIKTPNLDKLANDGVRFTNFYVTSSACTPSRGSLLTGRYPQRNGTYELFRNNRINDGHVYTDYEYRTSPERILGMDTREVMFPKLLKEKGYTNGIFGKWDLGQLLRFLPLQRGFDKYYGFSNTGIDYYTHERYYAPSMFRDNKPTTEDKGTYATYLFEREALQFINENRSNPFLLYLPFNAPHASSSLDPEIRGTIQAPPEYLAMYPEGTTRSEQRRQEYMAAVTCMDASIGKVLNLIEEYGLTDNTIVIFFSDNGGGTGSNNSPLSGGKATMWEGGLRVPCIIKWPGKIPENKVIDNFISSLEIFPTLLDITGIEKPDSLILDGFNILPLLTGEDQSLARKEMYWEFRDEYAARVDNWKWIKSDRRENMNGFFNLEDDIAERNDLTEKEPDALNMVKEKFNQWQKEMEEADPREPFRDF